MMAEPGIGPRANPKRCSKPAWFARYPLFEIVKIFKLTRIQLRRSAPGGRRFSFSLLFPQEIPCFNSRRSPSPRGRGSKRLHTLRRWRSAIRRPIRSLRKPINRAGRGSGSRTRLQRRKRVGCWHPNRSDTPNNPKPRPQECLPGRGFLVGVAHGFRRALRKIVK